VSRAIGVALAQYPAEPGFDVERFAARLRALVAVHPQMQLWAFPELHLNSPAGGPSPTDQARTMDDTGFDQLAALASELGIWLAPGSIYEHAADPGVHNTAVVFSPDGTRVATYRKMFPWRPLETTTPGTAFEVFDIPGCGRVGLSICYDIWFPEHTRQLAWLGADLVLNLVQTGTKDREQELAIVRGNAIMNQVWIASVNSAAPTGRGRSLVVDPEGTVRACSPDSSPELLTTIIDFAQPADVRAYGTAGVSKPWGQLQAGDSDIPLPLYGGSLSAGRWNSPPAATDLYGQGELKHTGA
jgi:predicted amidohydrolase